MITSLEDFKVYNLSMEMGNRIWNEVAKWNSFERETIGRQLVRSADSIAANLSEGLGRYHFKESKNFSYYSRGSLFETKTWITKAFQRNLLTQELHTELMNELDTIGKMLNSYIKSIGEK